MANKVLNAVGLGMASVQITGAVIATGGGLVSLPNPEDEDIIVLRSYLHVRTPSTGAANLDVGIGATKTTDATDMINALAVNGAIDGKTYNGNTIQATTKTEVSVPALWTAAKFLTVTGSADTTGLDAVLYIEYIRVGEKES